MKKNTLSILGAALLWLALLPAGGAASAVATAPPPSSAPLRVALLLDQTPGDAGPTDNLLRGLEKAKAELGIVGDVIILPDAAHETTGRDVALDAQEQGFKKAASQYDLIVAGSPALHELFMNHAGNYRRTRFIAVDGMVKAPNIASITFTDTQAAFLSGAAAATLTANTALGGMNAERILGWVGDYDTPSRRAEAEAFLQGARLVHPETRVITAYTQDRREETGYRLAKEIYAKGADIVAHSAGRAGLGVLRAASEQHRYALGHTQNQSTFPSTTVATDVTKNSLAASAVLFSQLHHSDTAVFDGIKAAVEGRFSGGTEDVRGLPQNGKEGGVGLSTFDDLQRRLGAAFPADLPLRLQELAFEIQRGGITLPKVQKKSLCDCL